MVKRVAKYDLTYKSCIYSGISRLIRYEIEHGTEDKREELEYLVNRYCMEEVISGTYLQKELNEYISAFNKRSRKNE